MQRSTARMVDESNVLVQMGLHAASFLALRALSRRRELEADRLGLCLARDAGEALRHGSGEAPAAGQLGWDVLLSCLVGRKHNLNLC